MLGPIFESIVEASFFILFWAIMITLIIT